MPRHFWRSAKSVSAHASVRGPRPGARYATRKIDADPRHDRTSAHRCRSHSARTRVRRARWTQRASLRVHESLGRCREDRASTSGIPHTPCAASRMTPAPRLRADPLARLPLGDDVRRARRCVQQEPNGREVHARRLGGLTKPRVRAARPFSVARVPGRPPPGRRTQRSLDSRRHTPATPARSRDGTRQAPDANRTGECRPAQDHVRPSTDPDGPGRPPPAPVLGVMGHSPSCTSPHACRACGSRRCLRRARARARAHAAVRRGTPRGGRVPRPAHGEHGGGKPTDNPTPGAPRPPGPRPALSTRTSSPRSGAASRATHAGRGPLPSTRTRAARARAGVTRQRPLTGPPAPAPLPRPRHLAPTPHRPPQDGVRSGRRPCST